MAESEASSAAATNAGDDLRKPDAFRLTPDESGIAAALASRVSVESAAKTSVISISVTMQDPMVSAMLADTVAERLKEYVIGYRTNKARKDMEYAQKINDEARQAYYEAQQRYASYVDNNQGIILRSKRNEEERLQNEQALAFNLYNTTAPAASGGQGQGAGDHPGVHRRAAIHRTARTLQAIENADTRRMRIPRCSRRLGLGIVWQRRSRHIAQGSPERGIRS